MKYLGLYLVLLLAVARANFDFTHHQNGHDLTVSLKDETKKTWVVFIEKNPADNAKVKETNRDLKNKVKQRLYNEDVYYTEVDLTQEKSQKDYKEFTDLVKLNMDLLKDGPAIALVYNKKGYWIHGHGMPQETIDTIHSFLLQKAKNEKLNKPVSVGGPINHPSSFESFGGGY